MGVRHGCRLGSAFVLLGTAALCRRRLGATDRTPAAGGVRRVWPLIIAMRNGLIHACFDLNADVTSKTVLNDLPTLLVALDHALDDDER